MDIEIAGTMRTCEVYVYPEKIVVAIGDHDETITGFELATVREIARTNDAPIKGVARDLIEWRYLD